MWQHCGERWQYCGERWQYCGEVCSTVGRAAALRTHAHMYGTGLPLKERDELRPVSGLCGLDDESPICNNSSSNILIMSIVTGLAKESAPACR